MEVQKYGLKELQKEPQLIKEISLLIKETFEDIKMLYPIESDFSKEVNGDLEHTITTLEDQSNTFYIIKSSEQKVIACLRGIIKEQKLNPEMGVGNAFFSKYVGTDKNYKRRGLASFLKESFEKDAQNTSELTNKISLVVSRVLKSNKVSQDWNKANGYTLRNEGENSDYVQFYKEYNPNK